MRESGEGRLKAVAVGRSESVNRRERLEKEVSGMTCRRRRSGEIDVKFGGSGRGKRGQLVSGLVGTASGRVDQQVSTGE